MTEERVRWRMTLQELCHATGARPADLEAWARLGAFGPAWKETTENKWRHITRKVARRAVVMSQLLGADMEPEQAAELADRYADALAKGETPKATLRPGVTVTLHPGGFDFP